MNEMVCVHLLAFVRILWGLAGLRLRSLFAQANVDDPLLCATNANESGQNHEAASGAMPHQSSCLVGDHAFTSHLFMCRWYAGASQAMWADGSSVDDSSDDDSSDEDSSDDDSSDDDSSDDDTSEDDSSKDASLEDDSSGGDTLDDSVSVDDTSGDDGGSLNEEDDGVATDATLMVMAQVAGLDHQRVPLTERGVGQLRGCGVECPSRAQVKEVAKWRLKAKRWLVRARTRLGRPPRVSKFACVVLHGGGRGKTKAPRDRFEELRQWAEVERDSAWWEVTRGKPPRWPAGLKRGQERTEGGQSQRQQRGANRCRAS